MLELVFAVVFLFYPSCSAAAFSAFSCEDFEGTRYLKADYSIDCDVAHNVERLLRARKGDVHAPIVAQEGGACAGAMMREPQSPVRRETTEATPLSVGNP